MQEELRNTDQSDQQQQTTSPDQLNSNPESKQQLDNSTDNKPLDSSSANQPLGADASTGQCAGQRLVLSSAVKQSAQYKQLVERLDRYNKEMNVDQATAANRDFNAQLRKAKEIQ